jgi:hypothetical protein
MARSAKEARQELERLKSLYAALPDKRDTASESMAEQIRRVEAELAEAPAESSGGGFSALTVVLIGLTVLALALAGGYVLTAMAV